MLSSPSERDIVSLALATAAYAPLENKLSALNRLRPEELQALQAGLREPRAHHPRNPMVMDAGEVRVVTSGWMGLARVLADGRRQILSVSIPGDLVTAPPNVDAAVTALTPARSMDARPLVEHLRAQPSSGLARAWARAQLDAQRNLLDQIVRLGSLTAYERIANLIVELARRHHRCGLSDGRRLAWPVTQETLSDILGLSIVHVNRVLQQLRRDRMIELRSATLVVCQPDRLADAGLAAPVGLPAPSDEPAYSSATRTAGLPV